MRLTVLCLALALAGCETAPKRPSKPLTCQTIERVVYVPLPSNLTDPLPVYERQQETFGEAWRQADTNTPMLHRCNADRAAAAAIQGTDRDKRRPQED